MNYSEDVHEELDVLEEELDDVDELDEVEKFDELEELEALEVVAPVQRPDGSAARRTGISFWSPLLRPSDSLCRTARIAAPLSSEFGSRASFKTRPGRRQPGS